MALKRIKATFFAVGADGRRMTFRTGGIIDDGHPAITPSLSERFLADVKNDYPFSSPAMTVTPATTESATAGPGERREVSMPETDRAIPSASIPATAPTDASTGVPDVSIKRRSPTGK